MKQAYKGLAIFIMAIAIIMNAYGYDFEVNGIYYDYNSNDQTAIVTSSFNDKYNGNINIPDQVSYNGRTLPVLRIGDNAFWGCTELESVGLPNELTVIGNHAFTECTKISKIKIPERVTYFGRGVFQKCSALSEIEIPVSITHIPIEAFDGCTNLTEVSLPANLEYIQEYAFYNCTKLQSIRIPAKTSYIKDDAFKGCESLETIVFEDNTEKIRLAVNYVYGPFEGSKPKAIYLGRSVESFPYYTRSLDLSQTEIISIGSNCKRYTLSFDDYEAISIIYSFHDNPENISFSFSNQTYINSILYVPIGTKEKYLVAKGWKNFFNIQEMDVADMWNGDGDPMNSLERVRANTILIQCCNGTLNIQGASTGTSISVYSTSGMMVGSAKSIGASTSIATSLRNGEIAIVKIGDKSMKVMMK